MRFEAMLQTKVWVGSVEDVCWAQIANAKDCGVYNDVRKLVTAMMMHAALM